MTDNLSYKIVEDNAGGLSLFVFEDGKPIYSASQLERCHIRSTLADTIEALVKGAHPVNDGGWEGDENPQADWNWFEEQESFNWDVIVEGDVNGSIINVNIMDYDSLRDLISIPLK